MESNTVLHAWFSPIGQQRIGSVFYKHAETGEPVEATLVGTSETEHNSGYSDIRYAGPVTKYVGCDETRREHNRRSPRPWKR